MDQTTITLQDLSTIVSIIDVCSERGAFKGNELMVVGQIREKVSAFVKQNQKTDDGATTTDESAQEETSSDE
jgi:hypothetical protein